MGDSFSVIGMFVYVVFGGLGSKDCTKKELTKEKLRGGSQVLCIGLRPRLLGVSICVVLNRFFPGFFFGPFFCGFLSKG